MKRSTERKVFSIIIAALILLIGVGTTGASTYVQALLSPDITVKVNGQVAELKDASGATLVPVLINGSTYLPVRGISETLDMPIQWDGETRTIAIGEYSNKKLLGADNYKSPYAGRSNYVEYTEMKNSLIVAGKEFKTRVNATNTHANKFVKLPNNAKMFGGTFYTDMVDGMLLSIYNDSNKQILFRGQLERGLSDIEIETGGANILRFEVLDLNSKESKELSIFDSYYKN